MDQERKPLYNIFEDEDGIFWVIDMVYYNESGPFLSESAARLFIEDMLP